MTLPKRPDTHKLEDDSRAFFANLVDGELFICREDGRQDYGVDLRLELLIEDQRPSNVHIYVQLKGHKRFEYDGQKVKQVIKVSTLEYLLNNPLSMVAAYSKAEGRVVYAMITKPYLKAINSSWRDQKTLTIYLENEFSTEAQKALHATALKQHETLKLINDQIETSITSDQSENIILLKDNAIPESQVIADLNKFGHALVNEGDLRLLDNLLGRISKKALETDQGLLMLQAHFYFNIGDLSNAEACARRYRRQSKGITDRNTKFVRLIELSVRRIEETLTGPEKQELLKTLEWDESPDYLTLWSDIIKSRALTRELSPDETRKEYEILSTRARQLPESVRELVEIQIEADRLSLEALFFDSELIWLVGGRIMLDTLGIDVPVQSPITKAAELIKQGSDWIIGYSALLERAKKCSSQVIYADVLYSYVISAIGASRNLIGISRSFPQLGIDIHMARERLEAQIPRLDYCFDFWTYIGDHHASTKALIEKHEIYTLLGKTNLAEEVAHTVIERIDRYDLEKLRSEIEQDEKGNRTLKFIPLPTFPANNDEVDYRQTAPED